MWQKDKPAISRSGKRGRSGRGRRGKSGATGDEQETEGEASGPLLLKASGTCTCVSAQASVAIGRTVEAGAKVLRHLPLGPVADSKRAEDLT